MAFSLLFNLLGAVSLLMVVSVSVVVDAQSPWCSRPDNVTCIDPPYEPAVLFTFSDRTALGVLGASPGSEDVFVAGGSSLDPQLWHSDDGGASFGSDTPPNGATNALGWDPAGDTLLAGCQWAWPDNGKNISYAQSRQGNGPWVPAPMDDWDEDIRSVWVQERGVSVRDGVFYVAMQVTYTILHRPYMEFYTLKYEGGGGDYEWILMPGEDYPVERVVFMDEMNGVAIAGQSYYEYDYNPHDMALIYVTSDGGASWSETWNAYNEYVFSDLECVGRTCWVTARSSVYAYEEMGMIMVSHDGGLTWETQFRASGFMFVLFEDLHFVDENVGFAAGNNYQDLVVMVTTNGGVNWDYAFEPADGDEWRHDVYDMYDVDGVCHLLVQEPPPGGSSMIIRLNPPSEHH